MKLHTLGSMARPRSVPAFQFPPQHQEVEEEERRVQRWEVDSLDFFLTCSCFLFCFVYNEHDATACLSRYRMHVVRTHTYTYTMKLPYLKYGKPRFRWIMRT